MPTIEGYSMGSSRSNKWTDWLASVDVVYQRLRARYKSVSVAGLSVGATLALALAQHRRDVPCIALWAVTLDYDGWLMPWYRWIFEPCCWLGIARNYVYRETDPYGLKNEKWRGRVADAMRRSGASSAGPAAIPAPFLYQAILLGRHAARHLSRVSADTLVMHSADDETASPRNADTVCEGIASAHQRKIMLGDSYHLITMDNERDLVARETIRFFQQSILRRHPDEQIKLVSSARALIRLQRRHTRPPKP
jgi:carboxylesterase